MEFCVTCNNFIVIFSSVSTFGIIGGGALLAGAGTVGAISTLPIPSIVTLGTLGRCQLLILKQNIPREIFDFWFSE